MDNYEEQIRIALANDFANRAKQAFSDVGRLAVIRKDLEDLVSKGLDESAKDGKISALEAHEMKDAMIPRLLEGYTPDKIAQQTAEMWIKDKSDYETQFEFVFQGIGQMKGILSEDIIDKEVPEGIRLFYDGLINVIERRDKIVNSLVEKAKKEGIDKATNIHTMHAAVKEEFPTAEEYLKECYNLMGSASKLLCSLSRMAGEDSFIRKVLPEVVDKATQHYVDTVAKADVEVLYKN